jgi:hypothetical protein
MIEPPVAGGLLVIGAADVAAVPGVAPMRPMSAFGVSLMISGNRERRSARLRANVSAAGAVGDGGGVSASGFRRGVTSSKRKSMGLQRELGDEVDEDRA